MTADSFDSATQQLLDARDQGRSRKAAFGLVPALAAVAPRWIAGRVQARESVEAHAGRQERVTERLAQAAGAVVLFDGEHAALALDARGKLGRNRLEREGAYTPDFELIEQLGGFGLVKVLHDGPHADGDTAAAGLEATPGREGGHLARERGRRVEPKVIGLWVASHRAHGSRYVFGHERDVNPHVG